MRQLRERGIAWNRDNGLAHFDTAGHGARDRADDANYRAIRKSSNPRRRTWNRTSIAQYLRELANALHTYYHAHQFIVDDADLRDARLALIAAARQVLHNGLALLGVSAPESM